MSGPRNGGNAPSSVAIATSHGSSIRRRASLKTQYAVAAQNTKTRNSATFRVTAHVLESKKSFVRGDESRSEKELAEDIPDRERGPHDREQENAREREDAEPLTARMLRSSSRRLEVGEEIERAGHEHRLAERVREGERLAPDRRAPRRGRSGRARARRARPPASARARRAARDEAPSDGGERREHRVHVLVGEDRRHHRVVVRRQMLHEPSDALGVVRAVADLAGAAPLEPARERRPAAAASASTSSPEERPRRRDRERELEPAGSTTTRAGAAPRAQPPPTPARRGRPCSPVAIDGELLGRDRLARRRRARRCARARRSSGRRRASRRARSSRRAGRRAPPRRPPPRPRLAERDERGRRQHLELRRPDRSAAGATRAERRLEVGLGAADADPLRPASARAARGTRRRAAPSARRSASTIRVVVDLPFVPTTWTAGKPGLRLAELGEQRAHPVEPEPVRGHGESASSQATFVTRSRRHRAQAVTRASSVELAPVALELRALGLDDLGRRVGDEALVREHPLGAGDLLAQPLALGLDVAARLRRSGSTTASKIRCSSPLERDEHAAAPERSAAASCTRSSASARRRARASGSGHGETISRVVVELRPDLLGHVRHHRMEQREQPLERGERGRDRRPRRRRTAAA